VEPRVEHKDTAFAGRASGGDHCWQAAVRLRQAKFRDFLEHKSIPPREENGRDSCHQRSPDGDARRETQGVAPNDRLQGRSAEVVKQILAKSDGIPPRN
jgi:hypothetical protein